MRMIYSLNVRLYWESLTLNILQFVADSQDMLEEIESLMKLDDLKLIPSSSATLSKRLKPVRVTDPFLMRFEQQLSIISG